MEESKGPDSFGTYVSKSLSALLFGSQLNVLLLCTPFAFLAQWTGWGDGWVFVLSLLSIAPFAERLSFVTEQLAMHTSETLGGLLNATFGNVTELIVSLFALRTGLLRIVQVRHDASRRRVSALSLVPRAAGLAARVHPLQPAPRPRLRLLCWRCVRARESSGCNVLVGPIIPLCALTPSPRAARRAADRSVGALVAVGPQNAAHRSVGALVAVAPSNVASGPQTPQPPLRHRDRSQVAAAEL